MAGDIARGDLGFGEELARFDPEQWTPAPRPAPPTTERQSVLRGAEALGFRSRETPAVVPDDKPVRRRRTGRNQQFNLKARTETIEAYCRIADANGWGLGETLEHAVALLEAHRPPR